MIQGSCLCGKVRYSVESLRGSPAYCHCTMCQKFHGSAFGTYVGVDDGGFQWLAGEERVRSYHSSENARRTFCGDCGSPLQMVFRSGAREIIDIALGSVDGDPNVQPSSHIFVADQAVWHKITDDLPQKQGWC